MMNLRIAKWGNSLAVRIPAEYVRQIGIKIGDHLVAQLGADGALNLRPPAQWSRKAAWVKFERLCANDLQLLPVEAMTFHKAAMLTMDSAAGLRAGDAFHLACAMDAKAAGMVTLDAVLAKNSKRCKVKPVVI